MYIIFLRMHPNIKVNLELPIAKDKHLMYQSHGADLIFYLPCPSGNIFLSWDEKTRCVWKCTLILVQKVSPVCLFHNLDYFIVDILDKQASSSASVLASFCTALGRGTLYA